MTLHWMRAEFSNKQDSKQEVTHFQIWIYFFNNLYPHLAFIRWQRHWPNQFCTLVLDWAATQKVLIWDNSLSAAIIPVGTTTKTNPFGRKRSDIRSNLCSRNIHERISHWGHIRSRVQPATRFPSRKSRHFCCSLAPILGAEFAKGMFSYTVLHYSNSK